MLMRACCYRLFFLFCWLLTPFAHAGEALPTAVSEALNKAGVPQSSVAVYVQAVKDSAPRVDWRATVPMNPASVMKLLTTYGALTMLKPDYRWKTEVYTDGNVVNGVLTGNLILKGYGDPSFDEAQFRRLLVRLQQTGVHTINGNLIIDKRYFATDIDSHTVFDDEIWRAYNAQPSAFLVDGRKTSFRFSSGNGVAQIDQETPLPEVHIVNQLQLNDEACAYWRSHLHYDVSASGSAARVTFTGQLPKACDDQYLELSLFDDDHYAGFMFKKLWQELGGSFHGELATTVPDPSTMHQLLTQYSKPLGSVIRDVNKWSNNLMARQLLLTIAGERGAFSANEAAGAAAINDWLQSEDISTQGLVIDNGAGLSRVARVNAQLLGEVLLQAYHGPFMPELMASLPILSLDGTLQRRLNDTAVSERAHLKTGSINGVSAIAGYVLTAKNELFVLVMLVNDANAYASKSAQDALINWVYAQP